MATRVYEIVFNEKTEESIITQLTEDDLRQVVKHTRPARKTSNRKTRRTAKNELRDYLS